MNWVNITEQIQRSGWPIQIALVGLSALVAYGLIRYVVFAFLTKIIHRSTNKFDDFLIHHRVFTRLSALAPLIVIYNFAPLFPAVAGMIETSMLVAILAVFIGVINGSLSAAHEMYIRTPLARRLSIKSYIQVVKLLVTIAGILVMISLLIGKSPWVILSGLGALTAVLILVFRDTILSFVAGIQISTHDLFRIGDWVEFPAYNADGDVIDIALNTVKIQNWDKTISVIPTYKFLDSSFRNWRGMQDSGGRRIKRSILIDINSIHFCDDTLLQRLESFQLLREYLDRKLSELQAYHSQHNIRDEDAFNARRLTNVGTFRAYMEAYLRYRPDIRDDVILMVRQHPPDSRGLPLEMYCFSNDTDWVRYEKIQSDIMDHLLAILPEFDLRVFQEPSGHDFSRWQGNLKRNGES